MNALEAWHEFQSSVFLEFPRQANADALITANLKDFPARARDMLLRNGHIKKTRPVLVLTASLDHRRTCIPYS